MRPAMLTKGGSGPSGLNAGGWRRILICRQFKHSPSDLCKAFTNFIKKLCSEELQSAQSLQTFSVNRLIPLDKHLGLRSIGFGNVLRRITARVVMMLYKKDVTKAV